MIEHAFADLDTWIAFYSEVELPVLRHTVQDLERLREKAESVNARTISAVILRDPLMTLRVLKYIEERRRKSQITDITTIERALMMVGIEPFFNDFQELPQVEDHLKAHPRALLGLLKVTTRARKASAWAREWALLRHDLDVDEITVATLLHDVAEILMWVFAPTLALKMRDLQAMDRTLRSVTAQLEVYNIRMHDLRLGLARVWHLPELLMTLMDDANAENPRVRNVRLAVDLARHSANGWDDAALPDDYKAIEDLLHINHETLMRKLGMETPAEEGEPAPPASDATSAPPAAQ